MVAPGSVHGFRYAPRHGRPPGHDPHRDAAQQALQGAGLLEAQLAQSFAIDAAVPATTRCGMRAPVRALAAEFRAASPGRVQALLAQATLIVLWFLRHRGAGLARPAAPRAMRDALVQGFRTWWRTHYREHQPLAFYAEALEVTPDHLSRTCRAVSRPECARDCCTRG